MPAGRRPQVSKPRKGKSSVEHRRPLGEVNNEQPGLGAGAVVSVEPYMPKKMSEDMTNTHTRRLGGVVLSGIKALAAKVRERKDAALTPAERLDKNRIGVKLVPKKLGEDKIGKPTASAEQIAKKHGLTLDQVNAQLDKGVSVEREHTNSDEEAREIARDHVHEFPDYYDRLDKMEKKAKEGVKEAKELSKTAWKKQTSKVNKNNPDAVRKALLRFSQIKGHSFNKKATMADQRESFVKPKKDTTTYPKQELPPKKPHPVALRGYERVKDGRFNVLRPIKATDEGYDPEKEILLNRIEAHNAMVEKMVKEHGEKSQEAGFHRALVRKYEKELNEDGTACNCVGAGMSPVSGEGNIKGVDPIQGRTRRKKFAGKQVFVVDPTTYHNAYLGKRKHEHYEKYLEGCDIAEEIREYGRTNWAEPIIIENEQTGAMVYLKYGSK